MVNKMKIMKIEIERKSNNGVKLFIIIKLQNDKLFELVSLDDLSE
jgi:hypothetical protein